MSDAPSPLPPMPSTARSLLRGAALALLLPPLLLHLAWTALRCALPRRRSPSADDGRLHLVVPYPPGERSGGSKAIQGLLRTLEGGFRVDLVPLYETPPGGGTVRRLLADWLTHALPMPVHCRPFITSPSAVRRRVDDGAPVVVEFVSGALFLFFGPRPRGRVVVREHESLVRRLLMERHTARGGERAVLALRVACCWATTATLFLKADRVVALTPEDAAFTRRAFPPLARRVTSIPVSVALPPAPASPPPPRPRELLMVANFWHRPNVDGLLWFLRECAPRLGGGWRLHLCGLDAPLDGVTLPPSPVEVVRHGFVDDLEAALGGVRIAVAPVVSGGGVRMKNLVLAASGRAVVTTPLGDEGIGFAPGEEALVCRDGAEMARALLALDADPARAAAMGARGRDRVRREFGPEAILDRYRAEVLGVAPPSADARSASVDADAGVGRSAPASADEPSPAAVLEVR